MKKVRIFSFSLFACFMIMGTLFTGTKAFSVETNEVKPGQDFSPTVKPIGRIQGKWEHGIVGGKGGTVDDNSNEIEQGSNFVAQRLRFGAKGKVLPTVGYLIQFDAEAAKGNVDLTYAWITIGIVDKYLNARLGLLNAPKTAEGTSSGTFLFSDIVSVLGQGNSMMGAMLYGSALNSQLHYYFWFANASGPVNKKDAGSDIFNDKTFERYQLGARLQYDFLRKWSHGKEWLQTKDMNGTLGVSVNYTPAYEDGAKDYITDEVFLHVNLGFTVSLFYLQGGVSMIWATAPSWTAENTSSEDQAHQMYLGGWVDVAVSATSWFVPAIRYEYRNAKLGTGTIEGLSGSGPSKEELMNLLVVLNFYPWSAGHRFKIQPEFIYRLSHTNAAGKQVTVKKGGKDEEYNAMAVRVGFTLNF